MHLPQAEFSRAGTCAQCAVKQQVASAFLKYTFLFVRQIAIVKFENMSHFGGILSKLLNKFIFQISSKFKRLCCKTDLSQSCTDMNHQQHDYTKKLDIVFTNVIIIHYDS